MDFEFDLYIDIYGSINSNVRLHAFPHFLSLDSINIYNLRCCILIYFLGRGMLLFSDLVEKLFLKIDAIIISIYFSLLEYY